MRFIFPWRGRVVVKTRRMRCDDGAAAAADRATQAAQQVDVPLNADEVGVYDEV